ncbi:MAG: hypothetical protein Q9P44_05100 [Anaerolineae bacterium]|nr:hypothetical protein [Anaerolineae bacterium]
MDEETRNKLTDVQARYAQVLMEKPNVVGVGIGLAKEGDDNSSEAALIVMVEKKVPLEELALEDVIPRMIEGVRVDVQETGGFEAL